MYLPAVFCQSTISIPGLRSLQYSTVILLLAKFTFTSSPGTLKVKVIRCALASVQAIWSFKIINTNISKWLWYIPSSMLRKPPIVTSCTSYDFWVKINKSDAGIRIILWRSNFKGQKVVEGGHFSGPSANFWTLKSYLDKTFLIPNHFCWFSSKNHILILCMKL